ncbi:DNA polymerase beta domain protein region [Caldicellulosiruptor hydrothermalis 108]|uniref:DNA polymerase beta domain protein region n=1 Tax=Caldicellulosiruptor hydrothermalis (strain DSM 18901 / VKM B-2411 / 108) TaxID=632292 RepID=E4QAL4_CALH1|nr:DNA polymerase beta domain protein region [Caldicellulosiruptor hydrothermalis 108]
MPEINIQEIKKVVVEILKKEISPWLIIIFGSLAKGNFRQDSDIDIAFFSDREVSNIERFRISQELADKLNRDVDLVDLKSASTVLKAQIVGTGEVIYCEDEKRKNLFFMRTLKEYALLNEERDIVLKSFFGMSIYSEGEKNYDR